jgi:hypothetical protein
MKAQLETHNGKVTLKVYYDPTLCNWDEAITAGLASYGLKPGQVQVIATPLKSYKVSNQNSLLNDDNYLI